MCVKWEGAWHKAKEDIIAYKLVRTDQGGYTSYFQAFGRIQQVGYKHSGTYKHYHIGKRAASRYPGIYLYCKAPVLTNPDDSGLAVLEVKILKETKVRWGTALHINQNLAASTINALVCTPLRRVDEEELHP